MTTEDLMWRAYSPSRDRVLFVGQEWAYVNGMTAYLNESMHHPDEASNVPDWVCQKGVILWEKVEAPHEE